MDNKQKQIKYNQQQYYKNKYKNKKAINDISEKIKNGDIVSKIIDNIIHRHSEFLNNNNIILDITPMQLLGCNKNTFKEHILLNLKENMTLENYGEWRIDHVYPISKIDFKNLNEIIKYYNYTNLQPLWMLDNIKKSNKIISIIA